MITPKNREYRAFEFGISDEEKMIVEGRAVVFEQPTMLFKIDGIEYYEVVDRHAFDKADMSDVVFVENHDGTPGARTRNKTLQLPILDDGVYARAELYKSSKGPAMYSDIKNEIYDRMSFSFTIRKDSYDKKTRTRRILEVDKVYDVSVVTFPAYEQTSISARSFFEAEAEKERMEIRMREEKKKRLELLIDIERSL